MTTRTQSDRELDWATGRELERKDAEIARLRAALELIAGGTADKLQALQARAALDNIGPSNDGEQR